MRLHRPFTVVALVLSLAAGSTFAQSDVTKKRAEIRKTTQTSLEKFYKAEPKLKAEVAKAPGYAVFTTYGLSFLVGGAGGSGVVHNAKTKKDTFMNMAQASAGLQAGIAENDTLIIFKSAQAMDEFVNKGWEFGAGGSASAGVADKSAGGGSGENVIADAI